MRRTERTLLLVGLLLVAVTAAAPGTASGTTGPVAHQAWAATGPAAPANAVEGNLYVSTVGGQEQARTLVEFDLGGRSAEDLAATTVTFQGGSDGVMTDQAALVACPLKAPLRADGKVDDPPSADCASRAPLTRGTDGSWSLPLVAFADQWSAGAPMGVAIVPNTPSVPSAFTVSLVAAKTAVSTPEAASSSGPADPASTDGAVAPAVRIPPSADLLALEAAPLPVPSAPASAGNDDPAGSGTTTAPAERSAASRSALPAADHPGWLVLLVPLGLLGAMALAYASRRNVGRGAVPGPILGRRSKFVGLWVAVPLLISTLGETTVYKLGSVAIVFIAAIGLHLLVNWTGELSLAHAGFIGLPAFAVAQFSAHSGLSPILGLPLAILTGILLGSIVGIAALRARGLQVALVTLAVGIAIGQFLFFRTWVIGPPQGLLIPQPSVFGITLDSSRALVPVLTFAVLLAVLAARGIMRSTIGRALLQVREDPDAAAAAGVAVARYRAAAYAFGGAFAGLAGWSYVVWVQQVTPKAFPMQLGFTYLVIAALAGPGGLGGVAVAALVIQGGTLFSVLPGRTALYLGPLALIYNVTRYQAGLNGLLVAAGARLRAWKGATMTIDPQPSPRAESPLPTVRPVALAGLLSVLAGMGSIVLAWYHMGNTDQVWIQNQELASGGLLGLGLVILGSALLVRDGVVRAAEVRQRSEAPPTAPFDVAGNGAVKRTVKGTRSRVKEPV